MFDFKGLIGALLRRGADEGVNDLKSATVWMDELPAGDVHQAQAEIIKTVAALNTNQKISTRERVRTIIYLDEKAQTLQHVLTHDYILDSGLGRHYLPTILAFWSEMANAYKLCLRGYAQKPSRNITAQLPLITARALHYFAMQAKWNHMRYLPVDGRVWRNLHRLYTFAENEGFASTSLRLYPNDMALTTCMQQYIQPLMLQLASPEAMVLQHIDQVDRWLTQWVGLVTLEDMIRPHRQLFAVNLDEPKPGRKLRRNMVDSKYRYWGTEALIEKIDNTITRLKQGELPARLGLGEDFRLQGGLDLLESLANRWSREGASATRKYERSAKQKQIQVIHGFRQTLEQLKNPNKVIRPTLRSKSGNTGFEIIGPTIPAMPEEGPELFDSPLKEWLMENESVNGIGASFVSDFDDDTLSVGDLIGLKPEEKSRFAIGIVRRIQKNLDGETYVGIETINQTPILVRLLPESGQASEAIDAIYLPEANGGVIPRCLLMSADRYQADKVLHLKAQGKGFTIKLKQSIETCADYARARFAVLAKHEIISA